MSRAPASSALLAIALLAGGCADAAEPPAHAAASASPSAGSTPEGVPSRSPSTPSRAAPTAASSVTAQPSQGIGKIAPTPLPMARANGTRSHLLTAETLPPGAEDTENTAWTVRGTGPEGSRRLGACQRTSLEDIGALTATIRVFVGPEESGLRARQVVARLADAESAWRAHEVLQSWETDCEEEGDPPATQGIVRVGRWLSIVEITATEGDVPQAWTRRAVRRIAATF